MRRMILCLVIVVGAMAAGKPIPPVYPPDIPNAPPLPIPDPPVEPSLPGIVAG